MKLKILVLLFLFFTISFADELRSLTNKGIAAFKKENYAAALEYFSAAVEKFPMSNEARFNKGLALGASGNAKDAETMLSSVKFDKPEQNAEVLYSRARIIEAVGDAAATNEQQPNVGEAKKAYQQARALYAQALDLRTDKKARKRTINNIEILSQKIKNLPEEEQKQDENQNENNDENKDNQDKKEEQKQDENKDNQQEQDKEDDENKEDEQKQDEEQQNNEQEENEQQEQQQSEQEEQIEDAIRLLEHYADDAKELNKPPVQKAIPANNGKDW